MLSHLPCSLYHLTTTQPATSVLPSSWAVKHPSLLLTKQLSDGSAPTLGAKLTKCCKRWAMLLPSHRCGVFPWEDCRELGLGCTWFWCGVDGGWCGKWEGGDKKGGGGLLAVSSFREGCWTCRLLSWSRTALTITRGEDHPSLLRVPLRDSIQNNGLNSTETIQSRHWWWALGHWGVF